MQSSAITSPVARAELALSKAEGASLNSIEITWTVY